MKPKHLNSTSAFTTVAISVVIGLIIGYVLGLQGRKQGGVQEAQAPSRGGQNWKALVDLAFPPPPAELNSLTGVIKRIDGATITLEIDDPDDYLPHLDGSPRKKQTRSAITNSNTKITSIDYSQFDAEGNPKTANLNFSDLKVDDTITVQSTQNIKKAQKFDVTAIEVVRY